MLIFLESSSAVLIYVYAYQKITIRRGLHFYAIVCYESVHAADRNCNQRHHAVKTRSSCLTWAWIGTG